MVMPIMEESASQSALLWQVMTVETEAGFMKVLLTSGSGGERPCESA